MSKEAFKDNNFRESSLQTIDKANKIIEQYTAGGYRLTARQLYYQFVSKNWIVNSEKSYKNLTNLISEARLAGLIDWDAIEDRGRVPQRAGEYRDLRQLVDAALASYRLPRLQGQECYVELWVEKQALAGVLWPIAHEHHITLMVNKGYSSQSAMYDSANRFRYRMENYGCERGVLLYLGDHDPSGEDMVRDIRDRFEMFGVHDVDVEKVALTMAQIKQYRPPPNPAKITDPRAAAYIEKYGEHSWEVDALPPDVLNELIEGHISALLDTEKVEEIKEQEEKDKKELTKAVEKITRKKV